MQWSEVDKLIDTSLAEDFGGKGDVTSQALFDDEVLSCLLISKDTGILAGAEVFTRIFHKVDSQTEVSFRKNDGSPLFRAYSLQ